MLMDAGHSCFWMHDDPEGWNTGCDNKHVFFDGGPKENLYTFCPYCGGLLSLEYGQGRQRISGSGATPPMDA